ncbi:MAG: MerR family transcriptional regulator [Bulleidia sp.]
MEMKRKHPSCGENMKTYRIGMFAAMNHVSVKTLRFYEEKGLLKPHVVDPESGYRYYVLSQMTQLQKINALKASGLTLDEIAVVLHGADQKEILMKKRAQILRDIAKLTEQMACIDGYLASGKDLLEGIVSVRDIPETVIAYMDQVIDSYDCLFDEMPAMGALMEQAGCICQEPDYCFTLYREPGYQDENIHVQICQAVTETKMDYEDLCFQTLPAVHVACSYHKGSYASLHRTYAGLLAWIENNGYEIDGEIRESYIDGVWNQEDEIRWLTEIQIPIRRKNGWNQSESQD